MAHSTLRSCTAAALSLLVAASGCGGAPTGEDAVRTRALAAVDAGGATPLAADELLTITLDAQLSTGFSWQVDEIDPAVLRLVSRDHQATGGMGGVDQETLRFAGVAQGTTSLGLFYRRPWDPPGTGEQVYRVDVDVAGAYTGPDVRAAARASLEAIAAPSALDAAIPTSYSACELDASHPYARCTPVKDQGSCGSCWAFATAAVFENVLHFADPSRNPAPDLSEQYLLSCNVEGWNCRKGGSVAFRYFVDRWKSPPEAEAGAVYEADFPYAGVDLACGSAHPHHELAASWGWVVNGGVSAAQRVALIQQAILDHGPVWVDVCADKAFQGWRPIDGVFTGTCTAADINHAVVLVGWGMQGNQGYWILRNSWGPYWGDQGYMRIAWGANQIGFTVAYVDHAPAGNQRPTARAGAPQTAEPGTPVTLDGSASSDPDGSLQAYAWVQTAGPSVALSGARTARATFTAPAVSAATTLSFRLTVTDDKGAQSVSGTSVTVQAVAAPAATTSSSGGASGGCGTGGGAGGWAALSALSALALARRLRTRTAT